MNPATAPVVRLRHQALLYDSADEFRDSVVPFIEDGVREGQPVLAVVSAEKIKPIQHALGATARGVDFVEAIQWNTFPGRTIGAYYRYGHEKATTHSVVRVVSETVWSGRDWLEQLEWKRFECVLNVTLARLPVWMLCPYNVAKTPGEVIVAAQRTHPELAGGPNERYVAPAQFYADCDYELPPPPRDAARHLTFKTDLGRVRRFVARHAPSLGLPPARLQELVLAVNEVATNAIRHGGGRGDLRMWRAGQRVLSQVDDPGQLGAGFFGYVPAEPASAGGHGLWITRQLCDLVEIRGGPAGTTVRLHMNCANGYSARTSQTHTSVTRRPAPSS
jgi:anti-sigma regulatory factor (Ser/Thr protein kinase)